MATAFQARLPALPIERILSRLDRGQIQDLVEIAIGLLDAANDDPELECDDHGEDDDPAGGSADDEGEEINEAEPLAPLTLNPDRDSWLN